VLAAACLFAMVPVDVVAHADLLIQIEEVTREIDKNPRDPELYIRRGELRRAHVEWEEAYADYERALALNPRLETIDILRGRLFVEAGWPLSARVCLDRFLARHTNHVDALILRGRALARLNLGIQAARDYDRALDLSPEPGPDLFVERSQVLVAEGPDHFTEAVRGLDEGLRRIGPLVTLQLYAIDIELTQRDFDRALARIDQVTAKSPRKETWLARRAEVLVQAGRNVEAVAAYKAALAALQTLPPTRRNVPAMMELDRRIRQEIGTLERAGSPPPKP
jgi:tetratricopeptide (TPR) repeat protein